MIVTASTTRTRKDNQRKFFIASTCASMLVFAALATMLLSMTSATSPLPAEALLQADAGDNGRIVVGMAHQQ